MEVHCRRISKGVQKKKKRWPDETVQRAPGKGKALTRDIVLTYYRRGEREKIQNVEST